MHYAVDGLVLYGMRVEAIGDRKSDDISVDMLTRLLVDVHLDSSKITESLISKYQSILLECAFMDDAMQARPSTGPLPPAGPSLPRPLPWHFAQACLGSVALSVSPPRIGACAVHAARV